MASLNDDFARQMALAQFQRDMAEQQQKAQNSRSYFSGTSQPGSGLGNAGAQQNYTSNGNGAGQWNVYPQPSKPLTSDWIGPLNSDQFEVIRLAAKLKKFDITQNRYGVQEYWVQLDTNPIQSKSHWQEGYDEGYEDGKKAKTP